MKIFNFLYKSIGQIFFVIIFLFTTSVFSLDKFDKADNLSSYFSGILLLNDNKYESSFNKCAVTSCISHFPDTNFWHYSLQLNTYRKILQAKYGKKVTALYLVCVHPDNAYKSYERFEVPILDKEMDQLFEERKQQIT